MLKFENPALKPFIILLFSFSFNDALSTPIFGNIPITPVQIAIIYGIIYLSSKQKTIEPNFIKQLKAPVILYYFIIIISTIIVWSEYDLDLSFLTIGFNLLWFLNILPFLSQGLSESDIQKFFNLFLKIILFITVPSGLYELITHTHIMNIKMGLSESTFYLRGFHIDKLEFGSMLASGGFIALIRIFNNPSLKERILNSSILLLTSFLTAFSFSTTSILGMGAGLAVILILKSKKVLIFLPFIFFIGYTLIGIIENSSLYQEQTEAYELKYILSVDHYEDRNFRYRAFMAALDEIEDSPFWGYGVGRSGYIIQKQLYGDKTINSHNIFANEMLDYGLAGFIPLVIFLIILYRILIKQLNFNSYNYSSYELLYKVSGALGAFMVFRFILYYHRLDQTFYFIWAALVVASYGSMLNRAQLLNKQNESTNLRQKAG